MRETNELKNKKGITLIALVITIIVMLILVAVTISMAVNGGLFDYAGTAVGETENAIEEEQLLAEGKIEIDGTWYNSIDEYIGTETITETHNWTRSGDTFTCSHCNTIYTMGDVVDYEPVGKESTIITAAMSGKHYDQTIEVQDATWVVLGIEDTNGNGTNDTLLITTQEPVTANSEDKQLSLYGATAYNNGPEEINRICKELYSNSSYGEARGMTIEDVNRTLGYTPTTAYYNTGSEYVAIGNLTTKLKELGDFFTEMVESGTSTPDEKNTVETLGEYELNVYRYNISGTELIEFYTGTEIKTITEVERDIIFGDSMNYEYFLATRGVYAQKYGTTHAQFCIGMVGGYYAGLDDYMYTSLDFNNNSAAYFRPVVSLISNLPTVV